MRIGKEYGFAASHQLVVPEWTEQENTLAFGKCNRLHGHNYKVAVEVSSDILSNGMVLNYYTLDDMIQNFVIDKWDHRHLNDLPEFQNVLPTAENLVDCVYSTLVGALSAYTYVDLSSVMIREGDKSYAVRP